ncbi:hypothetical protein GN958_ATG12020, partial [Phytophthora infestans]
ILSKKGSSRCELWKRMWLLVSMHARLLTLLARCITSVRSKLAYAAISAQTDSFKLVADCGRKGVDLVAIEFVDADEYVGEYVGKVLPNTEAKIRSLTMYGDAVLWTLSTLLNVEDEREPSHRCYSFWWSDALRKPRMRSELRV